MRRERVLKRCGFEQGKPVICVPIVEKNAEAILKRAGQLSENQIEMVEWRMDWFDDCSDMGRLLAVLHSLRVILQDSILLCTYRSKDQGGLGSLNRMEYELLLTELAASGEADIIDIEFFQSADPNYWIKYIQEAGNYVLVSEHNFIDTPEVNDMTEQIKKMHHSGGDIVKLAVMPKEFQDVLKLLQAAVNIKKAFPQIRLVSIAMGTEGILTRLAGECFGSCITFASFERPSAPGQMRVQDVTFILDKIHESCSLAGE